MNIAIDGYAGSGKSSIAHALAAKLGIKVLDTGAIYRGLACAYRDKFGIKIEEDKVQKLLEVLKVEVVFENEIQKVVINEKDYTPFLREEEISNMASVISAYKQLRESILHIQRQFARNNDCILEGRDIGTIVLPNADVKFFITASVEIRAERRFLQMKGQSDRPSIDEILKDIKTRDYSDEHRLVAPLKIADDAIVIDTSNTTIEQAVNQMTEIIKKRAGK